MNWTRSTLGLAHLGYDVARALVTPIMPAVRVLLVRDNAALLVYHSYLADWYLPGGGLKRGESLLAAARREAYEETGAVMHAEPWLLGIYLGHARGRSDHIAVFVSEAFDLTPATDRWEITGKAFFALDALPFHTSRGCRRRIWEYLDGKGPYFRAW